MKEEKKKYGGTKGMFQVDVPTNKKVNHLDLEWRNKANPEFLKSLRYSENYDFNIIKRKHEQKWQEFINLASQYKIQINEDLRKN